MQNQGILTIIAIEKRESAVYAPCIGMVRARGIMYSGFVLFRKGTIDGTVSETARAVSAVYLQRI